jgi:hypothetical protein
MKKLSVIIVVVYFIFNNLTSFAIVPEDVVKAPSKDSVKTVAIDTSNRSPWKFETNLLLNFSQIYFDNWTAGGEKSIAGNTIDGFILSFKKGNTTLEHSVKYAGGLMKQNGTKTQKTDDKFEINIKYGRKISKMWNYSANCNIQTQFFPGYKNPKDTIKRSDFLSPAYFVLSLGFDFRPAEKISIFMSPLSGKITVVNSERILRNDPKGVYGLSPNQSTRYELGGNLIVSARGTFLKNFNYQTTLNGFSNYEKEPQKLDWNWEVQLGMKLNKFISANVKTNLLYDVETSLDPQFKEFFGIGFMYKI